MSHHRAPLSLAAFGFAATLALTSAFAQGMGAGKHFKDMDTDGDGFVSSEEHAAWSESVFDAMDTDGSGDITETEYMAVRKGPGPRAGTPGPRHQKRQEAKKKRFKEMDADGDGKVSKDVFLAFGVKRFEEADTNHDGKMSPDEFRNYHWKK